jgi:hypothetical protein
VVYFFVFNATETWLYTRCDADFRDLDDDKAHLRTYEKTNFLLEVFDPGIVWDEYGLRSDVVVSHFLFTWSRNNCLLSRLPMAFRGQIFTN